MQVIAGNSDRLQLSFLAIPSANDGKDRKFPIGHVIAELDFGMPARLQRPEGNFLLVGDLLKLWYGLELQRRLRTIFGQGRLRQGIEPSGEHEDQCPRSKGP